MAGPMGEEGWAGKRAGQLQCGSISPWPFLDVLPHSSWPGHLLELTVSETKMKRHELGAGKRLCKSHLFSAGSFISFLLEYNCFTMLLVSAERQGESAACIHTALPSSASLPPHPLIPPLKVITEHWAELPVLCSSFPLAVFFFLTW